MQKISRRTFLHTSTALTTGIACSAPLGRTGAARLRMSLAAYSFRQFFPFQKTSKRKVPDKPMDMLKFIDFCADHGCGGAELTSYFFPHQFTSAHLVKLRRG